MWARTTAAAVTLPCNTSMLTGVPPSKHGIDWNSTLPLGHQVYPAWPTLFRLARENGYTSAMVAGKSKFVTLAEPGTLDWSYVPTASVITDGAVADTVVRWVERFAPGGFFVHLPGGGTAGHAKGWGSKEQLEAIPTAGPCLGRIPGAPKAAGLPASPFILGTSAPGGP